MTADPVWTILVVAFVLLICLILLSQSQQIVKLVASEGEKPAWMAGIPYYGLILFLLAGFGILVEINGWQSHILSWLNLVVRWAHVIIGIAWIGASFYFVFLENSLNRTENLRDELAGNLWAIHGGGFYYVEKYKSAPAVLPNKLHWFKYEAYFTWITGFVLMIIVYYSQAELTMIGNRDITPAMAIGIGLASLAVGWVVYDILCHTPLLHQHLWFFICMFLFLVLMALLLSFLLSPKAAYMHVGAMMGTMMAGNVFRSIIPSQKAMVKAALLKGTLDPALGQNAGLRSLHNNYFTLPVVFIMISNHFPSTFGHPYNWAILGGLILVSTGIRHYLNLAEKGRQAFWILPLATLGLLVLAMITAPPAASPDGGPKVSFRQVQSIFESRCNSCHASHPTDDVWVTPPNGVTFEEPRQIIAMKDQIMMRVIVTETMPQANKTNMTAEERELIKRWILQGASVD